jgi:uncharacterized membrane protein
MHAIAQRQHFARTVGLFGVGLGLAAIAKATLGYRPRAAADPRAITVRTSITIRREPADVYAFWRKLSDLPLFMRHLETVTESEGHSVWRARGPAGTELEWEAEIVADRAAERIAWRSLEGATIPNHGAVEFRRASQGRGTEVHLELSFEPPGGKVGTALTRLLGSLPEQQLYGDLRRLKQLLEIGEIVRSDASIHRGKHPAQPPERHAMPLVRGLVQL